MKYPEIIVNKFIIVCHTCIYYIELLKYNFIEMYKHFIDYSNSHSCTHENLNYALKSNKVANNTKEEV